MNSEVTSRPTKGSQTYIDFRSISFKGLNRIITTGWSSVVFLLLVPFNIYVVMNTSGFDQIAAAVFFPLGILVISIVSAQLVTIAVYIGLNLNKIVFRSST